MSVSGHNNVESLSVYQRVEENEKLMMGMCLSFSLLKQEDAAMRQNSIELPTPHQAVMPSTTPSIAIPGKIPIMPPAIEQKENVTSENAVIPLESALVPYNPPQPEVNSSPNIDLMKLIAEVEADELSDQVLILPATQCEKSLGNVPTTTTTTSLMKKTTPMSMPTFTNCSIGTTNIHIHKH